VLGAEKARLTLFVFENERTIVAIPRAKGDGAACSRSSIVWQTGHRVVASKNPLTESEIAGCNGGRDLRDELEARLARGNKAFAGGIAWQRVGDNKRTADVLAVVDLKTRAVNAHRLGGVTEESHRHSVGGEEKTRAVGDDCGQADGRALQAQVKAGDARGEAGLVYNIGCTYTHVAAKCERPLKKLEGNTAEVNFRVEGRDNAE
jgi:hypothetical protein